MPTDRARRDEILETAATLFASSGLRTSLQEIADAAGILPGSLYHHFESKEAIVVELVRGFLDDLERIAKDARAALHDLAPRHVEDRVVEFGEAIAACAVRNRAAVLLTLYDPPTVLGDELARLARLTPNAITTAMVEILEHGLTAREVRAGVDLTLLGERLCQSMLHVGVGVSYLQPGAELVPGLRCRILLRGVAVHPPARASLDRSAAMRAARDAIATWDGDDDADNERVAHLRRVARTEFGRRGYEATTIRDIAAAAGVSTGSVYRTFRSKDELLVSIMQSYFDQVMRAWDEVVRTESSALEKLDALIWVNINVLDRFGDEFKIQLAWLRQSPPSTPDLDASFTRELRQVKTLLRAGSRAGEIQIEGASAEVRARCLYEAVWIPDTIVHRAGRRAAQTLARDTLLRGALTRR